MICRYGTNTLFIISIRMFLLQVTDNPTPTDLYNKGIALFHKTCKSKIEEFPEVILVHSEATKALILFSLFALLFKVLLSCKMNHYPKKVCFLPKGGCCEICRSSFFMLLSCVQRLHPCAWISDSPHQPGTKPGLFTGFQNKQTEIPFSPST